MDDPRMGNIRVSPKIDEEPKVAVDLSRVPHIGQLVHYFPGPQQGFADTERHYGPIPAIILERHVNDPRIASLYFFAQNGAVGSCAHIPHRSLTPNVLPIESWMGKSLSPQSHWEYIDP